MTHPLIGQAENAAQFSSFQIDGAAGDPIGATLSVVPQNRIEYIIALEGLHNDPVARHMRINYLHVNIPRGIQIRSSETDTPVAPIAAGIGYSITRPLILTPGFAIRLNVIGLAAGQVATLRGVVAVLNLAEPAPPTF